jgi:hypothetical protein
VAFCSQTSESAQTLAEYCAPAEDRLLQENDDSSFAGGTWFPGTTSQSHPQYASKPDGGLVKSVLSLEEFIQRAALLFAFGKSTVLTRC